jgi:predicted RNase H-like HicB family nuclease
MNKRKFEIKLWKEKESNLFVITCDKPKLASQGVDLKEAFAMLGDAIQLYEDEKSSYTQSKSKEYRK